MSRSLSAQWSQIQRKLSVLSDHLLENHQVGAWSPNTDVCVSEDDLVVKMELAGVVKDNVRISLENKALVVEGVRRDPYAGESLAGYKFSQMELEYGLFKRVLPLPFPVDGNRARALFENGILRIQLPKAQESAPTKITVLME